MGKVNRKSPFNRFNTVDTKYSYQILYTKERIVHPHTHYVVLETPHTRKKNRTKKASKGKCSFNSLTRFLF